jgi:hypothetical protein
MVDCKLPAGWQLAVKTLGLHCHHGCVIATFRIGVREVGNACLDEILEKKENE